MGGGLGARWFWAFGRVPGQRLAGQVNVDLGAAWRLAGWAGYGPVVLIDSVEDGAGDAGSVVMEEDQDIEAIRAPGLNDIVKGGLRKGAAGMPPERQGYRGDDQRDATRGIRRILRMHDCSCGGCRGT